MDTERLFCHSLLVVFLTAIGLSFLVVIVRSGLAEVIGTCLFFGSLATLGLILKRTDYWQKEKEE